MSRVYLLWDDRAMMGLGTELATVFEVCETEEEACEAKGNYGGMACYSYERQVSQDGKPAQLTDERFEWDWFPGDNDET